MTMSTWRMTMSTTHDQDLMEVLSNCTLQDTRLTAQDGRGTCIFSQRTDTPLPTLTKSQKEESLHILSLTEIGMDTLATHLSTSGYNPPKEGTLEFAADFVAAASIASELVRGRPITPWDIDHLIPTQSNGKCITDLSASIFNLEGTRTSVVIDIAAEKYGVEHESYNAPYGLKWDRRVIRVDHRLVNELVKRRDDYVRENKSSWSKSKLRHLGKIKQD